jgi:hypothetical protein
MRRGSGFVKCHYRRRSRGESVTCESVRRNVPRGLQNEIKGVVIESNRLSRGRLCGGRMFDARSAGTVV